MRFARVLQSEEEWRASELPHQIIKVWAGRVSDRKARLFAAACLRRLWHWAEVKERAWAVEVLEQLAEGTNPSAKQPAALALRHVRETATWVMGGIWCRYFDELEEYEPGAWATATRTAEALDIAAGRLARAAAGLAEGRPDDRHRAAEQRAQCELLRCVLGNPFRAPVPLPDDVMAWNDGTLSRVARAAADERKLPEGTLDPANLAVLTDALEDAGCTDPELFAHLRESGLHVRGCWAVDLILGFREKEPQPAILPGEVRFPEANSPDNPGES